jgi:hypothetical protein
LGENPTDLEEDTPLVENETDTILIFRGNLSGIYLFCYRGITTGNKQEVRFSTGESGTMSELKRVGDLEITQDLDFQQKEWKVERIGWVIIALFILAGFIGLFGQGPLSGTKSENGPVSVRYQRIERWMAISSHQIWVQPEGVSSNELRLLVSRNLLEAFRIHWITPEPDRVEFLDDALIYVFTVASANQPLLVTFHHQTERPGYFRGYIGIEDGELVEVSHFIFP